jgi:hypothetical protein
MPFRIRVIIVLCRGLANSECMYISVVFFHKRSIPYNNSMNIFCMENCSNSWLKVQPPTDLQLTKVMTKSVLRKFQFKVILWIYNIFPAMYLTTVWITFLYFVEKTSFLLFCNRETIYLNPPWPAGECILHITSYLWNNVLGVTVKTTYIQVFCSFVLRKNSWPIGLEQNKQG